MSDTKPDPKTIAIYNARAREYAENFATSQPSALLTAFIARLSPGDRVLDLGAGPGDSSAHMAAAGLTPDPLDASTAMVAEAQTRYALPARQGDFADLQGPYAGIWANFSLLHMPKPDLPAYLDRLHENLTPGGLLHIALKSGAGEARDKIGRRYSYYTANELSDLLRSKGFAPEPATTGRDAGLSGEPADWFALLSTRS